ncbi:hypothetical protein [Salinicola halophyticus]|uniref:hypothetical protein n=1 Tax=Salinicola halophyticus TaxID=1808881 RepID=UPI0013007C67|nr:hypothetical protein [Salinicola halophyticus]
MTRNRSLFQLPLFWIALAAPLFGAMFVGVYIVLTTTLYYVPGSDGLNGLLRIFKVPIGIVALVFPGVALVASAHRSDQTKNQIEEMRVNNNFSNYFKHREEFEKFCHQLENKFDLKEMDSSVLYGRIFPGNSPRSMSYTICYSEMSSENPVRMAYAAIIGIKTELAKDKIDNELLKDELCRMARASKLINFIPRQSKVSIPMLFEEFDSLPIFFENYEPYRHISKLESFLVELNSIVQFGEFLLGPTGYDTKGKDAITMAVGELHQDVL